MPSKFKKLPPDTKEKCRQRAQALLDVMGQPPYALDIKPAGTEEELLAAHKAGLHILSEYVMNWLPQLVQRDPNRDLVVGAE